MHAPTPAVNPIYMNEFNCFFEPLKGQTERLPESKFNLAGANAIQIYSLLIQHIES
jgi:hypothetical protein